MKNIGMYQRPDVNGGQPMPLYELALETVEEHNAKARMCAARYLEQTGIEPTRAAVESFLHRLKQDIAADE